MSTWILIILAVGNIRIVDMPSQAVCERVLREVRARHEYITSLSCHER